MLPPIGHVGFKSLSENIKHCWHFFVKGHKLAYSNCGFLTLIWKIVHHMEPNFVQVKITYTYIGANCKQYLKYFLIFSYSKGCSNLPYRIHTYSTQKETCAIDIRNYQHYWLNLFQILHICYFHNVVQIVAHWLPRNSQKSWKLHLDK